MGWQMSSLLDMLNELNWGRLGKNLRSIRHGGSYRVVAWKTYVDNGLFSKSSQMTRSSHK